VPEQDLLRRSQNQEDKQTGLRKESDISRYVRKSWSAEKSGVERKTIILKTDRWLLKSSDWSVFVRYELVPLDGSTRIHKIRTDSVQPAVRAVILRRSKT
jgi:hypothetical protein